MKNSNKSYDKKLVFTYLHHKINELYQISNSPEIHKTNIAIPATERFLSHHLLITRRHARVSCTELVDQGFLKTRSIGKRALYGLTGVCLDTDINIDFDLEKIDSKINDLADHINNRLVRNNVPVDHQLQLSNPFHVYFLKEVFHKFDDDYNICADTVDQCVEQICSKDRNGLCSRSLAIKIRSFDKSASRKKSKIPEALYKKPDKFLERRYHLRKKGIDIFLLDDPYDPDIEIDTSE